MNADQVVTLVVAAVGIVGTAVSTLLASWLARRSEALRVEREVEVKRAEHLLTTRRALFVQHLQALARAYEAVKALHGDDVDPETERRLTERAHELANDLYVLETEIRLLAPEATDVVQRSYQRLRQLRLTPRAEKAHAGKLLYELRGDRADVEATFRSILGIPPSTAPH